MEGGGAHTSIPQSPQGQAQQAFSVPSLDGEAELEEHCSVTSLRPPIYWLRPVWWPRRQGDKPCHVTVHHRPHLPKTHAMSTRSVSAAGIKGLRLMGCVLGLIS